MSFKLMKEWAVAKQHNRFRTLSTKHPKPVFRQPELTGNNKLLNTAVVLHKAAGGLLKYRQVSESARHPF
jgi:hypothetical protein